MKGERAVVVCGDGDGGYMEVVFYRFNTRYESNYDYVNVAPIPEEWGSYSTDLLVFICHQYGVGKMDPFPRVSLVEVRVDD